MEQMELKHWCRYRYKTGEQDTHDVTNVLWPNMRRTGRNKVQREKFPAWRRGRELFTCDRDFLRELIWDDWSDCSWSDRICLIFSFSMATVLKADFSREWTATQMRWVLSTQNYHNLHRWHKRRPENVLLMNKGVYTWTCLLCIKFNWEYPGRNLKVIFPKKKPQILMSC